MSPGLDTLIRHDLYSPRTFDVRYCSYYRIISAHESNKIIKPMQDMLLAGNLDQVLMITDSRRNNLTADLLQLYHQAHERPGESFGNQAFAWLLQYLRFDTGAIVTSFSDRPAYLDANFHGYQDPTAMLASWTPVSHLDQLSPRMLANPRHAQRQDIDDVEIAGEAFTPLRDHLRRFNILYSLCIAIPLARDNSMTVFILTRCVEGNRFADDELVLLEQLAPHLALALALARDLSFLRSKELGLEDLPVAITDNDGRLIRTTAAFNARFWGDSKTPTTTQLEADCLQALTDGACWPLPDGQHALHGVREDAAWLLRIRPVSPLDCLTHRERQVATLYASGMSRKEIARATGSAPSTVKNQLSNCYRKLKVSTRKEIVELAKL